MDYIYPRGIYAPIRLGYDVWRGEPYWNAHPLIYFVLRGEVRLSLPDSELVLTGGDVHIVNAYTSHSVSAGDAAVITAELETSFFERALGRHVCSVFSVSSGRDEKDGNIELLRAELAQYARAAISFRPGDSEMRVISSAFRIMHILETSFSVSSGISGANMNKYIADAMTYISTNYSTLGHIHEIAEHCHIADSYLARLFREYIGMGPAAYLESVRLGHAAIALTSSDKTISAISAENGFPSARAFSGAFQKKHGMLPSEYRSIRREDALVSAEVDDEQEQILSLIEKFSAENGPVPRGNQNIIAPAIDVRQTGERLGNSFFSLLHIGNASLLLEQNVDAVLCEIDEIPYTHAYINEIFDREILPCAEDKDGNYSYYFSRLDTALDILLSHGLKPFINMSFLPEVLMNKVERKNEDRQPADLPDNLGEWSDLIVRFLEHIQRKYGSAEIRSWMFVSWSYPFKTEQMRHGFSDTDFFPVYKCTHDAVRGFDSKLSFGATPSFAPTDDMRTGWYRRYMDYCAMNDCRPDFLCFITHLPVDNKEKRSVSYFGLEYDAISRLEEAVRPIFEEYYPDGIAVYITEWYPFSYSTNLLGDTIAAAAYLGRMFMRHHNSFSAIGYSPLSDRFDIYNSENREFYGYSGLMSKSGIRKPTLIALWLLARMGDEVLMTGEDFMVSRRGERVFALMTNATDLSVQFDYSRLNSDWWHSVRNSGTDYFYKGERVEVSAENRQIVYAGELKTFKIPLAGLEEGQYELSTFTISAEHGNALAELDVIGGEQFLRKHRWERERLKLLSTCAYYHELITPKNGKYTLEHMLEPNNLIVMMLEPE